ncbi:hypothetical protein [Flaviaesturariibacter aridisoli]|uniref:CCDC81-like prokaryotic HU domain-containing protein n=1 Tax=Flaviaesturariibacter aridisoli TaxID=2545761 RepID=A0A4R4DSN8_9BACT|nr:hypothetical protein [Flaviaesturariibacter aridisoli]TCZ65671.1 hypothetical protein E0486_17265 [Flaviaesturariibacter aridisoli]
MTIPHLGSLSLQRQAATWSVADQELQGPAYRVHTADEQEPAPQQLAWIAGAARQTEQEARESLQRFGARLQLQLRREPFLWPGVGLLQWHEGRLQVEPATPVLLPPQAAGRVIREDARHTIRVGEQEVASSFYEERTVVTEGRHDLEWLAWLIAVLAALFVFYCIYSEHFSPLSSGLRTGVFQNLP